MLYPNTMSVKLRVPVYSIVNIIQIVHTLCGNSRDTRLGMDIKIISPSVIHTSLVVNK